MKTKFVERESYMHKFAKNLLAEKLSESDKANDFNNFNGIKWRSNYGVFTELKFYETSDQYYFECSEGLIPYNGHENNVDKRGKDCLKWFDESFDKGRILFVPDICIFHKGTPTIFIEVVYTHSVSREKINAIDKFFGAGITVYEVSATEILNCVDNLDKVKFKEVYAN